MEALAERGGVEEKTMKIETNVFDREEKPMDEYIKRDALIKAIKAQFEGRPISEMDKMWNAALSCAIGQVESEPSADVVERKHGKWKTAYLDHEAFGVRPHTFYCSECHQITSFRTFFCPNCGEDMRGEDDV